MLDAAHFNRVPVAELVSAQKRGPLMVYQDHWWAVDAQGNALFYTGGRKRHNSPQCNTNKLIVERIAASYPEPTTAQLLPWAYLQFDISDYC